MDFLAVIVLLIIQLWLGVISDKLSKILKLMEEERDVG